MGQRLPQEILERIFMELAPYMFLGYSFEMSRFGPRDDLKRAARVCSAWRTAAQSRLHCIASLESLEDIDRLHSYPAPFAGQWKVLRLSLYDRAVAPAQRLSPAMLKDSMHMFNCLQQLHVETHNTEDDVELARLIRSLQTLRVLVVVHAFEAYEYDSGSAEGYSCYSWEPTRYNAKSVSFFPSLLTVALPALSLLQHLAIGRMDLGEPNHEAVVLPSWLKTLVLIHSVCSQSALQVLLDGNQKRLRHMAIVLPHSITKDELIKTVKPQIARLQHLALVFPWRDCMTPPLLAGWGAKLNGVVAPILAEATHLRSLHCQDSDMCIKDLKCLPNLQNLAITVDDLEALDTYVRTREGITNRVVLGTLSKPRILDPEYDIVRKQWKSLGVLVEWAGMSPIEYAHMSKFGFAIPDPIVG